MPFQINPKITYRVLTTALLLFIYYCGGTPVRFPIFEVALWTVFFGVIHIVTKRYWFPVVLTSGFFLLINYASFVKQSNNGQKLYFSDLAMLTEAAGFLMDYVTVWALLSVAACIVLAVLAWRLEPPTQRLAFKKKWFVIIYLLAWVLTIHFLHASKHVWHYNDKLGFRAVSTFVGSLFHPLRLEIPSGGQFADDPACCAVAKKDDIALTRLQAGESPHIVSVLLESEFDVQRLHGVKTAFTWHDFKPVDLGVYVKGAGTWVQEYAFLHGVRPTLYGAGHRVINRLGPGLLQGRIAPALFEQGYEPVTIVPYKRNFYASEVFHQSLGMKAFVDCSDMGICDLHKNEADTHLLNFVTSTLQSSRGPQFVFALTMHQHSPHSGFPSRNGVVECAADVPSAICGEINEFVYRDYIIKSRIEKWLDSLNTLSRRTVVLFWGDHVPSFMTNIPDSMYKDGDAFKTVAFLYDTSKRQFIDIPAMLGKPSQGFVLNSEDLDLVLLKAAGYQSKYTQAKLSRYPNGLLISKSTPP